MTDEPIGQCPECDALIYAQHPYGWCSKCGEALPDDLKANLQRAIPAAPANEAVEPKPTIIVRYRDAYRVARSIIAFGATIKVIGGILGGVLLVIGLSQADGALGAAGVVGALVLGAFVGLVFWRPACT